jgi:hypothetical protein
VSDAYWPEQFGTRSYVNVVADYRRATISCSAQAYNDAGPNATVVTELCISTDYNSTEMIDNEISSNHDFTRQFDTCDNLDELEKHLINKRKKLARNHWSYPIAPSTKPINDHYPEPLTVPSAVVGAKISTQVLKPGACRSANCSVLDHEMYHLLPKVKDDIYIQSHKGLSQNLHTI